MRRLALASLVLLVASTALAKDEPDPKIEKARKLYAEGIALVTDAQWGEALAKFEASAALRAHPVTTYNVGVCERALGRYVRAHATFVRALAEDTDHTALPASMAKDAAAFRDELERLLVRIELTVEPREAGVLVDGRPLAGGADGFTAGARPAGPAEPLPEGKGTLVLDPGAHVITLTRKGFSDVVVNKSFAPGTRASLPLALARLPATVHVSASQPGSIVSLSGFDVGVAPVELSRPAGTYKVLVRKAGFEPYSAEITVAAGEDARIVAEQVPKKVPVTKTWWFWTSAAAVVGGGVAATYFLTRKSPSPPPYDGGSTGWVVTGK